MPHAVAALSWGRAEVSDLFFGPESGNPFVALAVPVFEPVDEAQPTRRAIGAIGVTIPRERLAAIVARVGLQSGGFSSVQDRRGATVARSLRDAETLGKLPMPAVLAVINGAEAGLAPRGTRTLEGMPSTIAFARAPLSGYVVKLDVPDDVFLAPLRASLLQGVVAGMGVLAVGLLLAFWMARRTVAAFGRVPDVALGSGGVVPAGATGLREAADLAIALASARSRSPNADASLRVLFESSLLGVVISDAGGRVHAANDAFLHIIGRTRPELEAGAIRWDEITPDEWIGRDEAAIGEAVAAGRCTPYEKEYVRPDGTRVPVLVSFGLIDPTIGRASAFVVDITKQKAAEAALRRSEERLRLAQEAGEVGAWEADLIAGRRFWSEMTYRLWGLEPGTEITPEFLLGLIDPEDRDTVRDARARALAQGGPLRDLEFRIRRASDGEARWLLSRSGTVACAEDGRPLPAGRDHEGCHRAPTGAGVRRGERGPARLRRGSRAHGRLGVGREDGRTHRLAQAGGAVRPPGRFARHPRCHARGDPPQRPRRCPRCSRCGEGPRRPVPRRVPGRLARRHGSLAAERGPGELRAWPGRRRRPGRDRALGGGAGLGRGGGAGAGTL
jgi:PAS domain S-box-containing protein